MHPIYRFECITVYNFINIDYSFCIVSYPTITATACLNIQQRTVDDGFKVIATTESILSNASHALGDGDGGEAAATIESTPSYPIVLTFIIIGKNKFRITTQIASKIMHAINRFECITVYNFINIDYSFCIVSLNIQLRIVNDGFKVVAILESILSNARHALGDGDGGEVIATTESTASNARHALGDNGGGATLN